MSAAETVKKSCIIPGHCKAPIVVPMLTRQIKQFKNTGSVTNVISLQHEHPIRPIQNIAIVSYSIFVSLKKLIF